MARTKNKIATPELPPIAPPAPAASVPPAAPAKTPQVYLIGLDLLQAVSNVINAATHTTIPLAYIDQVRNGLKGLQSVNVIDASAHPAAKKFTKRKARTVAKKPAPVKTKAA